MSKGAMSAVSVRVLQYLTINGLSQRADIVKAVPELTASTLGNLQMMGHVEANREQRDNVRYAITAKGRNKLANVTVLHRDGGVVPPAPRVLYRNGGPVREGSTKKANGYDGHRELQQCWRPGAMDAAALPSRFGDRLHWPDGRITSALDRGTA